ncbi:MAG: hypothetical protein MZU79_01090 [Anaerotruncus sp.]|nr:hypothetical protein [Anaerotruncus sp.]
MRITIDGQMPQPDDPAYEGALECDPSRDSPERRAVLSSCSRIHGLCDGPRNDSNPNSGRRIVLFVQHPGVSRHDLPRTLQGRRAVGLVRS